MKISFNFFLAFLILVSSLTTFKVSAQNKTIDNAFKIKFENDSIKLISRVSSRNGMILAKNPKSGKFGYLHVTGKLLPFIYDKANEFETQFAIVSFRNKYGIINNNGDFIIEPKFNEITFNYPSNLYRLILNDTLILLTEKCEPFSKFKFNRWGLYLQDYFNFNENLMPIVIGKKSGFLNKEGGIQIDTLYDQVGKFENGVAWIKLGDKYGVINSLNKIVLPIDFDYLQVDKNLGILAKKDDKFGLIDFKYDTVLDFEYDDISNLKDGFILIKKNGLYGIMNNNRKVIIPCFYNNIEIQNPISTTNKFLKFLVKKEKMIGVVNVEGKVTIAPEFDGYGITAFCPGLTLRKDKLWGFYNIISDSLSVPANFESINGYYGSNGILIVKRNNNLGGYNLNGELILDLKYEEINPIGLGLLKVKENGKYGIFDSDGKTKVVAEFDKIEILTKDGKREFRGLKKDNWESFNIEE